MRKMELIVPCHFGLEAVLKKEIIDLILESSQYMRDMLYSLLKAFKDNHGSIKFERQNFDVYKLISKIIKEMNDLAVENNIKINFESTISDNNKMIYADEIQLRRVVGNILNNAISYGYKNTEINVKMWTQGQNLKISFENTSDIIPDDLKNIIFDKYVCGKNVTSGLGIGLGLYFCKKVLEAHEGNIHLETNGNDHLKIIVILTAADLPSSLCLNYSEFPNSCLLCQLSVSINLFDMLINSGKPNII